MVNFAAEILNGNLKDYSMWYECPATLIYNYFVSFLDLLGR